MHASMQTFDLQAALSMGGFREQGATFHWHVGDQCCHCSGGNSVLMVIGAEVTAYAPLALCRCRQALLYVWDRAAGLPAAVLVPGALPQAVAAAGGSHAEHACQGRNRRLSRLPGK